MEFLAARLGEPARAPVLREYEAWWSAFGRHVSEDVDRLGTPPVRMFDALGSRRDEILYPRAHRELLRRGFAAGAVWPAFESGSLRLPFLLGAPGQGVRRILEALNLSRVANAVGSAALVQRAHDEAEAFARGRVAFGRPIAEHPLLARQLEDRARSHARAFAPAWEAVTLLDETWRETPPYSPRYHLMRLVAHLAKFRTAELAVADAVWAMEVHGGAGVLADFPVERLLREAMILPIWEGTPHRQILDGLEAIQRRGAHRLLAEHLRVQGRLTDDLADCVAEIETLLESAPERRERDIEPLFRRLAEETARALAAPGL